MFDRLIKRDSRGRISTLRDALTPDAAPIVEVLVYDGESRLPLTVCVRGGAICWVRQSDGSYKSSGREPKTAADLRLNQRTGRLDWVDSQTGPESADVLTDRRADEGVVGLLLLGAILFPPAWPLIPLVGLMLAADALRERRKRICGKVLDFLTGAYRV